MKIFVIASQLLSFTADAKNPRSLTLATLHDLEKEFRYRVDINFTKNKLNQFNSQMDHIVAMFNTHEKDAVECYKKNADLFEGQIESADSVLEYASALTKLIDNAFGDCENYIDIQGRAAELRWNLLEDPNEDESEGDY